MKKILFYLVFIFSAATMRAQFVGQFNRLQDGHIYFTICNQSYFPQVLGWFVVNEKTYEHKSDIINYVAPGQTLYFGPANIGWTWQQGEKFIAISGNGLQMEWICPYKDLGELSFYSNSSVHGSCNIPSHNCKRYIDIDNNNLCDNCPREARCHITRHQTR